MKITILTLLTLLCLQGVNGQSFTIKNGSEQTCSGYFYDSGGKEGNYSRGEDYVFTLSSGSADAKLIVQFDLFRLNGEDWLAVYDGDFSESNLIDTYTTTNPIKGDLKSASGKLTFVFHSSAESFEAGWVARVICEKEQLSPQAMNIPKKGLGVLLTYSVRGMKSEADFAVLEKMLKRESYIISTSVYFEKEILWVSATESSYVDEIKKILLASQKDLGYEYEVDFLNSDEKK